MARLDGCTETVDVRDLPAGDVMVVLAELLLRLDLVVARGDYGRGVQLDLIMKQEAKSRAAAYDKEWA